MKLENGTLQKNCMNGTRALSWALGKFSSSEEVFNFHKALFDKAVPFSLVDFGIGRGGKSIQQSPELFVLASVFDKIKIHYNDYNSNNYNRIFEHEINDNKFGIGIIKEKESNTHGSALRLRIFKSFMYNNKDINDECFNAIEKALSLNNNNCTWIVTDITIDNDNCLHIGFLVLSATQKITDKATIDKALDSFCNDQKVSAYVFSQLDIFSKLPIEKKIEIYQNYCKRKNKKGADRYFSYLRNNCESGKKLCDYLKEKHNLDSIFMTEDVTSIKSIIDEIGSIEEFKSETEGSYYSSALKYYDELINNMSTQKIDVSMYMQKIIYGAPGTGKSYSINKIIGESIYFSIDDNNTKYYFPIKNGLYEIPEDILFRTTFHPDYDYAQFVGCYKPTEGAKDANGNVTITYKFVPEVFVDAYVKAWNQPSKPVFLIIEEINRGNCAQIFGDLFQLLDRNDDGESEYSIKPDKDLEKYLKEGVDENGNPILTNKDGINNGLRLPANFNIIATMNTSDQSLFPMDSAFKRRWEWKYEPIKYENMVNGKDKNIKIILIDKTQNAKRSYKWNDFQRAVNYLILRTTSSEDKQMGDWFLKEDVNSETFISKVMFYLWNDVCKENYGTSDNFFRKSENEEFSFGALSRDDKEDTLVKFMEYLREAYLKSDEWKKTPDTQQKKDDFLKGKEIQNEASI